MRLLPQKRWKKIMLIAFLALIIVGAAFYGYIRVSINKDVVSPIEAINTEGSKKALVVYQVGLSSGPKDASYAYAQGLGSSGWRAEITTASLEAPSNLSDYKLLVLVFPIYGARPGEAAVRYVERLGNLQQIPTVIIDCRWSNAIESVMKEKVTAQNGTVIETLLAGAMDLGQHASQINR
jgi:hypothetical protein